MDGDYRKLESDLPTIDDFDKNGNKLNNPYLKFISCIPQTLLIDKKWK